MKKRVSTAYLGSLVLPVVAFVVVMLRVFGEHSRGAGLLLYALGWLLLILAVRGHARARAYLGRSRATLAQGLLIYGRHVAAAAAFVAIGVMMLVLVPVGATPFLRAELEQVRIRVEEDRARVVHASIGQGRAIAALRELCKSDVSTDAIEKLELRRAWVSYLDFAVELDQLLQTHKYFYQINALEQPELNARSFLVGYAALVQQMKHGLELSQLLSRHRNLETWLDEADPSSGLAQGTYFHFRQGLTRADGMLRLQAGLAYSGLLAQLGTLSLEDRALMSATRDAAKSVLAGLGRDPAVLVDNPLDRLEKAGFQAWFPLQKGVAVAISDLRTTRRANFVGEAELATLLGKLEPADVLLERRNWYVTNVGLPGFWPHAALYVGTPAELDAYFDGAARAATSGLAPSEWLAQHFPEAFAKLSSKDERGESMRVIEAVGEDVVLHSLEYSAHADYVAALRPRLDKKDKLASLMRAFEHYGKPYDYDFDFVTDEAVVCSELVFKALQPAAGKAGIEFELSTTSGRLVLPPNEIARKFDLEAAQASRALDFVAYFEGNEEAGRAFERSEAEFRASWRKPKWDIAQP